MATAVCPYCRAATWTATGYCDVCRQPLAAAVPAAPYPQAAAPNYGYPPPSPYGPPPGYAPPYGWGQAPGFAAAYSPPPSLDPPATQLAKLTTDARWGAGFLDMVFLFVIWMVIAFYVYPMFFAVGGSWWYEPRIAVTAAWSYLYYALLEGFAGGTPGKRVVGLVLVDKDLKPITAGQAFLRAIEFFLWPLGLIIGMVFLQSLLIEKNGQSAGDRLARTFLVRRRYLAAAQHP